MASHPQQDPRLGELNSSTNYTKLSMLSIRSREANKAWSLQVSCQRKTSSMGWVMKVCCFSLWFLTMEKTFSSFPICDLLSLSFTSNSTTCFSLRDYDITRDVNREKKVNIMFSSSMNTAIYSKQTQILLFIFHFCLIHLAGSEFACQGRNISMKEILSGCTTRREVKANWKKFLQKGKMHKLG